MALVAEPDRLLADLNDAQLEAVRAVEGPLAIIAGAGTGKTRVISRRTAFAIATGAIPADQVLVVTFTDKAAGEMADRLRRLGLAGVTARTFHAHALSQLRFFWPLHHDGAPLPALLDSKLPLLGRIVRRLPGHYRFTPAKDLADEIEWAKSRRVGPGTYERAAAEARREPPIPVDLFVRAFGDYERAKVRAGRMDFDDLLTETIELLAGDPEAAATVRARKRWFSVDEYQDTNPLQERLLELWAGDSSDVCVVGDADQTIYTFAGASPAFLETFADRHPGARVVELTENYRSTPEVLDIANRLLWNAGRPKTLQATRPPGPVPEIVRHPGDDAELAWLVSRVGRLHHEGTRLAEIAVLVRTNAQIEPVEAALTRAGIPFRVRGLAFFRRPDVRAAIDVIRRSVPVGGASGRALATAVRAAWTRELGFEDGVEDRGNEARERAAALGTLSAIVDDLVAASPALSRDDLLAELGRRAAMEQAAVEADDASGGVELATYHRAKGLEWDAVFLPMLEEGSLPIRQAFDDDAALDEERRLLYVGITRARLHLALSWAERRDGRGAAGRGGPRRPSRFLAGLLPAARREPSSASPVAVGPGRPARAARPSRASREPDTPVMAALREWRWRRAQDDGVAAFVVAHDATLRAIAEARPSSLTGLARVKGMGPTKLERYGAEILVAIASVE
ncbi:MAG TPA: ATP-dependent DNA helicase UvrD2 [Candidatus Limnocylindrales bacterium]|nr:ATP-dependent DNA helicase UvrD2 [Candidatus Limnocylindrales bacterium]